MSRPAPPRALARGLACALLFAAPKALAAGAAPAAGLALEWTAPPGCPDAAEVRALAVAMLGDSPGGAAETRVRAQVVLAGRGFTLTIETRSASGTDTRRLEDPRCSVLAEAAAMIAATAVDPSLAGPAPVLSPGPGSELIPSAPIGPGPEDMSVKTAVEAPVIDPLASPELDGAAAAPRAGSGPAADERRLRAALRLSGLVDLGSAPGPTGGLGGSVALLGRLWRAELAGLWLAPQTVRPDPVRDIGARIGLLAGSLRGCLVPRLGRLEVPTCAGLEVGAVRGEGVGAGIGAAASDVLPWVGVLVGPGLIYAPIRRLALTLQVDLVVPLLPLRFAVGGYGEVYRGGVAAGRAALGLEVRFR